MRVAVTGVLILVASVLVPAAPAGAACTLCDGSNIVLNGDGEVDVGAVGEATVVPTGWTTTGDFRVVQYDQGGYPTSADNQGGDPGESFLAGGGNDPLSTATQEIVLGVGDRERVNAGAVQFDLSADLGGFDSQGDNMVVRVDFVGSGESAQIGPVTPADRGGETGLLPVSTSGTVPPGTDSIVVTLEAERLSGIANDGYGDNVSLVLTDAGGGPVADPVPEAPADVTTEGPRHLAGDYQTPNGTKVRVVQFGPETFVGFYRGGGPLGACLAVGQPLFATDEITSDDPDVLQGTYKSFTPDCTTSTTISTLTSSATEIEICPVDFDCVTFPRRASNLQWQSGLSQRDVALGVAQLAADSLAALFTAPMLRQIDERVLYVATDANFADALAVAGITGANSAFFLQISPTDRDGNLASIARLRPDRLVVVGGQAALPDAVLPPASEIPRTRIGGATRYETATALSTSTYASATTVYVAVGDNFPDALAAGAQASLRQAPILLTRSSGLPDATAAELARLDPDTIYVLGGAAVIPDAVVAELSAFGGTVRIAGATRHETAERISQLGYPDAGSTRVAWVANSRDYRNALAVAGNAWALGGPLLLTPPTGLSDAARDELSRLDPATVILVSDNDEFDPAALDELNDFLATID